MTYKERLIAKRMIDLKELANKYAVKINEKGSKAAAVDKILQKIDEILHQEFTDKEIEKIKADLDQGVTLTTALEQARAAIAVREFEDDQDDQDDPDDFDDQDELETTPPAELAPTEPPVDDQEEPEEHAEQTEPVKPAKPAKKTPATRKSKKVKELTYNGKTQSIKAWAEELNLPYPTLYDRINRNGWSVEEAIEIPLGGRR